MVSAEYGGTGGRPLEGGMCVEEPDIEIGQGVSSKGWFDMIATNFQVLIFTLLSPFTQSDFEAISHRLWGGEGTSFVSRESTRTTAVT